MKVVSQNSKGIRSFFINFVFPLGASHSPDRPRGIDDLRGFIFPSLLFGTGMPFHLITSAPFFTSNIIHNTCPFLPAEISNYQIIHHDLNEINYAILRLGN